MAKLEKANAGQVSVLGIVIAVIAVGALFGAMAWVGSYSSNTPAVSPSTATTPLPTSTPIEVQATGQPKTQFGDGTYIVGTDIQPGTYRSDNGSNCYYARLSDFGGGLDSIIANGGTDGSNVVTIAATDKGFESERCGTWTLVSPPPAPKASANNSITPVKQSIPVATTPAPAPAPKQISIDWSSYASVPFETYRADPQAYLGEQVMLEGFFDGTFFPQGGSGGDINFVGFADYTQRDTSQPQGYPHVNVEIDNSSNYTAAVSQLQGNGGILLKVYGIGVAPRTITMTNGTTLIIPFVSVKRIDECLAPASYSIDLGYTTISGLVAQCTSWQTVFPAGISPSTISAPASATTTSVVNTPSNSRYFQLGLTGVCTNSGNNGTILLDGWPLKNSYSIPSDDIVNWADGDIAFTVPSVISSGTYQVTVRGYQPGTGYCPEVNGGNITIQ